ncbi:MAG: phage portal protein, partial [Pseudomonadota bacterium]
MARTQRSGLGRLDPFGLFAKRPATAAETKASAARPLIALHGTGAAAWTPRDYASLAREGYQKNVIAYRCIRMVAEAAASTPFAVSDGGGRLETHPVIDLLRKPNGEQSGPEVFEAFYGFLLAAGNAYLEAVRLDADVREIYVLRPDRMKVRPGASGWPDAYEYAV